jgi:hypothetical protein
MSGIRVRWRRNKNSAAEHQPAAEYAVLRMKEA